MNISVTRASNIGMLKDEIRKNVIPIDDVDKLNEFLPDLTRRHQTSLLSTCIRHDAINCFKALYHCYYPILAISTFEPIKILLYLANDQHLYNHMLLNNIQSVHLANYFCIAYRRKPCLQDALNFYLANNVIPAFYILGLITDNEIDENTIKIIRHHAPYLNAKPFTDKYPALWNSFPRQLCITTDISRVTRQDFEELLNFPWEIFGTMSIYPAWQIMLQVYPDNLCLNRRDKTVHCIAKFLNSARKKVESRNARL